MLLLPKMDSQKHLKWILLSLFVPTVCFASLEGMWTSQHTELGGVFFRIKSDGSCTYFLEEGTDTAIHKGTWNEIPTGIEMKFENGSIISAGEIEEGVADVRMDFSAAHDVTLGQVVSQGVLLPSKSIGRMTVNPDDQEEDEERIGYFGAWEGELLNGEKFYIFIDDDRTCGMSYSNSNPSGGYDHVVGYWRKDGEKLQMYWNDGSFTIIETNGRRIEQTSFKVGELLEEAPGFSCSLLPIREKDLPEEWYDQHKEDYVARMPVIVLRHYSQMKSFFKAEWIIDDGSGVKETVRLRGFGNARTTRYGGIKGDWLPGSDSANIVWRNGVKETLRTVGNQFVLMSYNPNQPVSGRPTRISLADPSNPDKMGYYINRKTELLDPTFYYDPSTFQRVKNNKKKED